MDDNKTLVNKENKPVAGGRRRKKKNKKPVVVAEKTVSKPAAKTPELKDKKEIVKKVVKKEEAAKEKVTKTPAKEPKKESAGSKEKKVAKAAPKEKAKPEAKKEPAFTPKVLGTIKLDEEKPKGEYDNKKKKDDWKNKKRKKLVPTASSQDKKIEEIDLDINQGISIKKDLGKKDRRSNQNDRFETRAGIGYKSRKQNLRVSDLEKDEFRKNKYKKKASKEEEIVLDAGEILIDVPISVGGLASQTKKTSSEIISFLWSLNIPATINSELDEDSVLLIAEELGLKIIIGQNEVKNISSLLLEDEKDDPEKLVPRPPIVTIMGHVDHGKTSLLDAIRDTNVTDIESGGITQHIGASEVTINDKKIVFLDTPGHEAFSQMRARGASATDIAVLVVAQDDGVKPQTIESINHAKAAGVPIIVAINKMDKEGANPDRVKKELSENNILVEDWGGNVPSVLVSAKSKNGIKDLLEIILIQAEVLELKANPDKKAKGIIIESKLDVKKGVLATALVLEGTLNFGSPVVAGTSFGKVRNMRNDKGKSIKKALPATAVEILGLDSAPEAGDKFNEVDDDKTAREIALTRKTNMKIENMTRKAGLSLENLFDSKQEIEGKKQLNLIIKTDVSGSLTPINDSLLKLSNDNININIVHSGVGAISDSDISLAVTSNSIVIGFHVRPSLSAEKEALNQGIEIRTYKVIYDITDDIKKAMEGLLEPEFKENILGRVEIREIFKVSGVGTIGGAFVTYGEIRRNAKVRLLREGTIIHEGEIASLKRFKDDAKEVKEGFECGIGIKGYDDIKIGDEVECFIIEEVKKQL